MKIFSKLTAGVASLSLAGTLLFGFGGVASAACWQYTSQDMQTSQTPVFNNICNVPYGTGDESDFVRIRPNTTGDPTSTSNNSAYISTLDSACNDGDTYDVHTYIHNDASQDFNDNGNGSAVAHNVAVAMNASLGATQKTFSFSSAVSASNASSVSDSATLNCNGEAVKLSLVPSSVHIYSQPYGWQSLGDNAVNGSTRVGSPTVGSGDQWGCWTYRIIVVYTVKVNKIPQQPQAAGMCQLFSIVASEDRKVTINKFSVTQTNASLKSVVVNWGDNSTPLTATTEAGVLNQSHQYAHEGTFNITAVATFAVAGQADIVSGGAGTACAQQVSFTHNQPPVVTTVNRPTTLVNTGAGSVASIFAATTAAGALAYRWMLGRRLSRQ